MDINFNIGGAAGQGINTIGDLVAQVFVKNGLYTFTIKDYMSRVRGGYNFTQIRVSDEPVHAPVASVDVIIALTKDAIINQRDRLVEGGVIIFDESLGFEECERCHLPLPLEETAEEVGGDIRMMNAAALGALLSVLKMPITLAENALADIFGDKGRSVVEGNIKVARTMYEEVKGKLAQRCDHDFSSVEKGPSEDRLLVTGNQAIALGAMAANLKWISAYPMSPSTSLFQFIIQNSRRLKIGGLQTEDEIAGLNMALGASHTGARSMVTTSGGGFSLMVEAVGLAGMVEIPIVIYNAQRPGPSTGLPTRTEQGDLLFMLHSSQGEFPRIMIAPKDPLEAFYLTKNAFRLADEFQVPVMLLGDQHLAEFSMNIPRIEVGEIEMDRGKLAEKPDEAYKRFKVTDDGVSPRAFPGDEGVVVAASGNTHNEFGHISEDPDNRNAMVEKRLAKIPRILDELEEPRLYGNEKADYTLLTWGSTWGATYEAMLRLSQNGVSVNQLHFGYLYPLKTKRLNRIWNEAKKIISVEQNATSQFAKLVRMESGLSVDEEINKYDGRPMTPEWIINELKEVGVQ